MTPAERAELAIKMAAALKQQKELKAKLAKMRKEGRSQ